MAMHEKANKAPKTKNNTSEHVDEVQDSATVKQEPHTGDINSTFNFEVTVKKEPEMNDGASGDITEMLVQGTSSSFCYEAVVKEEMIMD